MIRPERPTDADAIRVLTAAAFLHAPHASHTEHRIVDALRAAGELAVSLVEDGGDGLLGHVALSPVHLSDGTPGWFGLGPVSVHPGHQGRGIGRRLVDAALARLREDGAAGCVVLGDPGYYGRFGFLPCPGLVLPGVPAMYFQALAFDGATPQATVAYSPSFAVA